MTREMVIETLENLATTCGRYGRLLKFLEEMSEADPERFEEIMSDLESADDACGMILKVG